MLCSRRKCLLWPRDAMAAAEQICSMSGALPLSVLQGLQFQGAQFKTRTYWGMSVHHGKSLGQQMDQETRSAGEAQRRHLLIQAVVKPARHRLVNTWCPKEPGPAQPLACKERVLWSPPNIWKCISQIHHCPGKLESPLHAHFHLKHCDSC